MNSKRIKKIIIFLIVIFIICFIIYKSGENTQYMNNLDYNINLLENGDMEIIETWDMYINHTNTIFRDLNLYGYDNIENISVVDLETGKELNKIDQLRTVTTDKIFNITDEETASIEKLNSIITEETKWAEETNKTAEQTRIFLIVVLVLYVILFIRFILKIIKYVKINKRDNDGLIKKELICKKEIL